MRLARRDMRKAHRNAASRSSMASSRRPDLARAAARRCQALRYSASRASAAVASASAAGASPAFRAAMARFANAAAVGDASMLLGARAVHVLSPCTALPYYLPLEPHACMHAWCDAFKTVRMLGARF